MTVRRNVTSACFLLGMAVLLAACSSETQVSQTVPEDGTAPSTESAMGLISGLQVGEPVGAFDVVKVGGVDDGVEIGAKLCYT